MPVKLGNNGIAKIYLGNTLISKAYKGNTVVYNSFVFEPEYQAVLDYADANSIQKPSLTYNLRNNNRIKFAKQEGLYSKIDLLYFFDQEEGCADFAKINVKNPSSNYLYNPNPALEPDLIPLLGFKGDGTKWFQTDYFAPVDGVNFTNVSASIFYHGFQWDNLGSALYAVCGARTGSNNAQISVIRNSLGGGGIYRIGHSANTVGTLSGEIQNAGITISTSTSYSNTFFYRDAILAPQYSVTKISGTAFSNLEMYLFAQNENGTSAFHTPYGLRYWGNGSQLTAEESATLFKVLNDIYEPTISSLDAEVYLFRGQSNILGRDSKFKVDPNDWKYIYPTPNCFIYNANSSNFENVIAGRNSQGIDQTSSGFVGQLNLIPFFAKFMSEYKGKRIYCILYGVGGTQLDFTGSGATQDWHPDSNELLTTWINQVESALSLLTTNGITYTVKGDVWWQGESDATNTTRANDYQNNETAMYSYLEAELPILETIPRVVFKIFTTGGLTFAGTVNTAKQNRAALDDKTIIIEVSDYSLMPDGIHASAASQIEIGTDLFNALKDL
jgi:hypothetical protein